MYSSDYCYYFLFTDIDDCINNKCENDATCIDGVNSYTCKCSVGYTGGFCENSKLENIFYIISLNVLVFCHLLLTHLYVLFWRDQTVARQCETICIRLYFLVNMLFTDIDDCVNHNCANGGSCMDGVNTYTCNCPPGFTGMYCEKGQFFTL